MRAKRLLAGVALSAVSLALAACGGSGPQQAGPMSESEEGALAQAAQMLDDPRTPTDEAAPANQKIEGDEREGL